MGLNISDREMLELSQIDIGKKYTNGECPPNRSKDNLTRGKSYLIAGVMHRFFHKNFNLYKALCPLDKNIRDNHWWLESQCRNYVIDLTEEQYLNEGIKNIREQGQLTKSIFNSDDQKIKDMAYIVAVNNFPKAVNYPEIKLRNYSK